MLRVVYFPKGSPEFNAVEECWRQGKHDLLVSKYYPRFTDLKKAIAEYYKAKFLIEFFASDWRRDAIGVSSNFLLLLSPGSRLPSSCFVSANIPRLDNKRNSL